MCALLQVQYESEALAAHQNLENDKLQLYDTVRNELEEKIRRLEEDRHNIDISSGLLVLNNFSASVFVVMYSCYQGCVS